MQRENIVETWKPIDDYERRYLISNFGVIKNTRGKLMKYEYKPGTKYLRIALYDGIKTKKYSVHRLVAMNFIGQYGDISKLTVNHIDGNKENNKVSNLEWCTISDNLKHAYKLGLNSRKGERNCSAKLTYSDVKKIRHMTIKRGEAKKIAKVYGVQAGAIRAIVNYKTWNE